MRLTKEDVAHIATFKEGAFKSWAEIIEEVKARRNEFSAPKLSQAKAGLRLTFD